MTVGERIELMKNAEDSEYNQIRLLTHDEFIEFVKQVMPERYEDIRKKEENYQKWFKNIDEGLKELKD
jgi:bifunctional DNA-binding transcriptional regulator/antitoxin component of YhaV-PrlF toxin-antitoxin module